MKKREKKMNFVTVTGGNKTQRKVAETTTHQMIAELLPRFRTLDIEVKLKKFTKITNLVVLILVFLCRRVFPVFVLISTNTGTCS